jgi:hypothetical protein
MLVWLGLHYKYCGTTHGVNNVKNCNRNWSFGSSQLCSLKRDMLILENILYCCVKKGYSSSNDLFPATLSKAKISPTCKVIENYSE